MQCDPVSIEHDEKSSVLTNKGHTMINTVLLNRAKHTKLYRVNNVQTKATNTVPNVPLSLLAHYMNISTISVLCQNRGSV